MGRTIHYSDGSRIENAVIVIWEDWSHERRGVWYRAYWASGPDATQGSPVIGYCSPRGSRRTVRGVAYEIEARGLAPGVPIYRNGREVSFHSR
jgi:hypothetical protein